MAKPGQMSRARKASRLLARYCDTFGEMQLRKYTERAIRAARAEAELNHRSKSAFLSTMSHELRTPLNAIIGFSDLVRTPGATSNAEAADYASHIASAGRRLLDVVSDVLDMSMLESGSLALDLAAADAVRNPGNRAGRCQTAVRRQAAARGHRGRSRDFPTSMATSSACASSSSICFPTPANSPPTGAASW